MAENEISYKFKYGFKFVDIYIVQVCIGSTFWLNGLFWIEMLAINLHGGNGIDCNFYIWFLSLSRIRLIPDSIIISLKIKMYLNQPYMGYGSLKLACDTTGRNINQ